jgi:threonine/homoserine/homoserine lactone efflux protein
MHPIFLAVLTGFISGFILSVPVGPINLTIMNEGARRGFKWAALIGLGASIMEVIYCTIAFTGFSDFFGNRSVKAGMELFSFVFMLVLGIKFLLAKTPAASAHLTPAAEKIEERIEQKLHPHSAFMVGFVRVLGNPGVLLFWIMLSTFFITHEWVEPNMTGKLSCITGVAFGTCAFFLGLAYAASLGHGKFNEKTLLKMERFSGVGLLTFAFIHGGHIIWQMAHHKI